jgi:hypothetical protein
MVPSSSTFFLFSFASQYEHRLLIFQKMKLVLHEHGKGQGQAKRNGLVEQQFMYTCVISERTQTSDFNNHLTYTPRCPLFVLNSSTPATLHFLISAISRISLNFDVQAF